HGSFTFSVRDYGDELDVDGIHIEVVQERDPAKLQRKSVGVDVVLECTGLFTSKEKASAHLEAGANRVLISAPAGKDVDATIVYGVNHQSLNASHRVISNDSCTTNCRSEEHTTELQSRETL